MAELGATGGGRRRPPGLTIPIDVERDTRWALVELLYGLQRDARRRWRITRARRWWRVLVWMVGAMAASGASMAADHRLHLLESLIQRLG